MIIDDCRLKNWLFEEEPLILKSLIVNRKSSINQGGIDETKRGPEKGEICCHL